jgi:hypothetical protein
VRTNRRSRWRAGAVGVVTAVVCLALIRGAPPPPVERPDPATARNVGLADLPPPPDAPSWAPQPLVAGGLRAVATAGATGFALHTAGGEMTFLPGVNLGASTPGHQPGALAMAAADYRAWFGAMRWLGVRVVRVYTIHPPAFYAELAAHNRAHPDRPIYLMHGVHLPDESYVEGGDLYDPEFTAAFAAELRDASAAASGALTRPPAPGRAAGTWTTDVGPWLVGWIVGVEWDPTAVAASDAENAAAPAVSGRYFRSGSAASPTERWLAARMDELATAEAARGRTMPIAFVNWPTTDPLRHPDEPLATEDLVGIDANHVVPTPAWPGGTFASYHAYPYYPDFQRHEAALGQFRHEGRLDPYAGYLVALQRHHTGMPVMLTEFGVPSSLGSAHRGPLGRDQGGHSERAATAINADLLRLARDVGLAGALLFAWADEWFKSTWNTVNHQIPAERRALWHDPLTNEQHFGLLATDAIGSPENPQVDEAYLHLSFPLPRPAPARVTVGLDVLPTLGGAPPPGSHDGAADAAFELDLTRRTGQAWLRTELDPLPLDYPLPPGSRPDPVDGWRRFQLMQNRALEVPSTGRRFPAELHEAGVLPHGPWNPADPEADSRALWRVDGSRLVVRVPWAMAGFGDPSSRQVLLVTEGRAATAESPGIAVTLSDGTGSLGDRRIQWDRWDQVRYVERLKHGARQFRDALVELG